MSKTSDDNLSNAAEQRGATFEQCRELVDLAVPHIYRRNLFRVLGLPINATPKDVQRQQNRRKMQEKLGIASPNSQDKDNPLALDPAPTTEDLRAAAERMNRPVDRLLDEIFWFWPTDDSAENDLAMKALERGQLEEAVSIWSRQVRQDGPKHIATHNLAVLNHLLALDCESRPISPGVNGKEHPHRASLWRKAFAQWGQVLDGEEFWHVVRDRVRELDDKQLTTGFVRRIRTALPAALLLINAKIAVAAAEREDMAMAKSHVHLVARKAKYDDALVEEVIGKSLKPIRSRIKIAIDHARNRWTAKPNQGNQHVRDLHNHVKGLMAVIDAVYPTVSPITRGVHDQVAEAMIDGEHAFTSKTSDWEEGIQLLTLAHEVAIGNPVRSKLAEYIEINRRNIESGNDWYSVGYWELPDDTVASLESIYEKTNGGDYDGAIRDLSVIGAQNGPNPMRRCLSHCLSLRGIAINNNAHSEFSPETGVLKKILANLGALSESDLIIRLSITPDPNPYTSVPPCLCCDSTYYTSWTTFTFKDTSMFMCSGCAERHERQIERERHKLRKATRLALQYLLLADEICPGDLGVQGNVKTVKRIAGELNCSIPATGSLRRRLRLRTSKAGGGGLFSLVGDLFRGILGLAPASEHAEQEAADTDASTEKTKLAREVAELKALESRVGELTRAPDECEEHYLAVVITASAKMILLAVQEGRLDELADLPMKVDGYAEDVCRQTAGSSYAATLSAGIGVLREMLVIADALRVGATGERKR